MHTQGYAAPLTKEALNQAQSLIERAEGLGEPPEDPLLLLSVLYGFWIVNVNAFNGDVLCELAVQFLGLTEQQKGAVPLTIAHRRDF